MEGYPKFHNEPGVPTVRIGAASSSALGINRRKTTHTSTLIWAMPVRSSAPIVLRYSALMRACVNTKLIRQIVLTVTWTELKICSGTEEWVRDVEEYLAAKANGS